MIKGVTLSVLAEQISSCRRCRLYQTATQAVPGEGNSQAKIMFIGESPGYWEDQKGLPFCGAAGKLLDELLQSISAKGGSTSGGKLDRKEVFITNILKHRPPQNRDPLPSEIEACQPFLDGQIKIINPKIIVTLGRFSMNKFLPGESISRIHGQARFVNFAGRKRIVMPMYHPAAALRGATVMMAIKKDFQKIPALLKQPEPIEKTRKSEDNNEQLNLIN